MTQQASIHETGKKMCFDAAAVRRSFPILDQQVNGKPLVYLDSAASAQKPQMVLDTLSSAYSRPMPMFIAACIICLKRQQMLMRLCGVRLPVSWSAF